MTGPRTQKNGIAKFQTVTRFCQYHGRDAISRNPTATSVKNRCRGCGASGGSSTRERRGRVVDDVADE
jgi:hypothetical protein